MKRRDRPFLFCPYCRAELETRRIPDPDGPERRVCADCGFVHWGNSKPTAGGVVVDDAGRVLLARRAVEPFLHWWDIPGGFLEPGEHPEDGVRRELREETGLEIDVERLIGVYMDEYAYGEGGHTLNFHYLCRVAGGAPAAADDVEELAWFPADGLPEQVAFQNTKDALRDWRRQKEKQEGCP